MILQALNEYYRRIRSDPDEHIPSFGYAQQRVGWALHLKPDGRLAHDPQDLREPDAAGRVHHRVLELPTLPQKRASGILPQFLWDNTGYVLGRDAKDKPERAEAQFEAFRAFNVELLKGAQDAALNAVLAFLESWSPRQADGLSLWSELAGENVVFRLVGEEMFVHEHQAARDIWQQYLRDHAGGEARVCLVTGESAPIARLHGAVKGIRNAQSSGASLVSFNLSAFTSYGKEQNFNAPVSAHAAFAYTTALNHLLAYESPRKAVVGDTTVVFWSGSEAQSERVFAWGFAPTQQREVEPLVRRTMEALRAGKSPAEVPTDEPFHVVGLTGNSSRVAIRFWQSETVGDMLHNLFAHFEDLRIVPQYPTDREYPGLVELMREAGVQGKLDTVPPNIVSAFTRAAVSGGYYPAALASVVLRRIRADARVSYRRAAMLKAYIERIRRRGGKGDEMSVNLDTDSTNVPYLLGRLFAILERIQQDANPGIKATITDRYYGSASATPAAVFGQLLRLSKTHIRKADKKPYHEGLIQEVMSELDEFPRHLDLESQARFALGYYHQRTWFYTKKEDRKGGNG